MLLGAVALAWAIERPQKPAPPVVETYPSGWTVDPPADPPPAGVFSMRWPWWRAVLMETYDAMNKDRLLAVAAGVVFYGLLAIFPAITALVSSYGLFANASAIQDDLSDSRQRAAGRRHLLDHPGADRPCASLPQPSGLSAGFAIGFMLALWSANAGVKAMIDALNVIEGRDEERSFVRPQPRCRSA